MWVAPPPPTTTTKPPICGASGWAVVWRVSSQRRWFKPISAHKRKSSYLIHAGDYFLLYEKLEQIERPSMCATSDILRKTYSHLCKQAFWCGLCLCMFCIYVVLCCFRHAEHEAVCWGCWTLPSSNATATSFIRPCFGSHCVNISWTAEDWATIRNEEGRGGGQREYIILFILEKEGECVSVNDCGPHVVPFMLGGNSIDGFVFLIPIPST